MLNKSEAKYIQSLNQKKLRQQEGLYVVEGPKMVQEALIADNVIINKIYAVEEWIAVNTSLTKNVAVTTVTYSELERISHLTTPNQTLALIQIPGNAFVFNNDLLALALDGIQDPGNLGTIIRIADWFGVRQVICSEDCADIYNTKVVQATMGSIFRTEVLYTNLSDWLKARPQSNLYGAALNGRPLKKFKKISKGIIVIGNESKGIRADILALIQEKIMIEKWGNAESLNAAVATGIILSHLK